MAPRPTTTFALSAALAACTGQPGDSDTTGATAATDTGTTVPDPTGTTSPDATSTSTTTSTSTSSTTDDPTSAEPEPYWCNGYTPNGDAPSFAILNDANQPIADGSQLQVVCGGQGLVMLPIYPKASGFEIPGTSLSFDVVLDVEGFNIGPGGHFFEAINTGFAVQCVDQDTYYNGYDVDFVPIFPPDAIQIAELDGKPGVLHVTLHAPTGELTIDADIVIFTGGEDFENCGYG
jgi:hypothetical protein